MYYPEITFARAIACVGVVILHAAFAIFEANKALAIIFSEVFRFSTPLYVAISGFLLSRSKIRTVSFSSFIGRKVKFLIPPFLLWGIIYLYENIVAYGYNPSFKAAIITVLLGQSKGHLYFVPLIMQLYIIYYLIKRFNFIKPAGSLYAGITLTFVWYIFFEQLTLLTGDARLLFPSVIFAFAIGYYLGENPAVFKNPTPKLLFGALVIAAYGLFSLLSGSFKNQTIIPTWHVFSLIYGGSMIFIMLFIGSKIKKIPAIMSKISQYSFSIYLSHWICLDILNLLLPSTLFAGLRFIVLVLGALVLAYSIGYLGNLLPNGYYFVGRVVKKQYAIGKAF